MMHFDNPWPYINAKRKTERVESKFNKLKRIFKKVLKTADLNKMTLTDEEREFLVHEDLLML